MTVSAEDEALRLKKRLAAWRSESRLRPYKHHQASQGRVETVADCSPGRCEEGRRS